VNVIIVGPHRLGRQTKEDVMTKFVYLYSGGQMAETPEAQEESMRVWGAWFGALGDSVVDIGNPFGASAAVNGGGTSGLTGYSIVNADSLDDAVAKASSCPIIEGGGGVEVYETMDM
jgi:hypothetical protein